MLSAADRGDSVKKKHGSSRKVRHYRERFPFGLPRELVAATATLDIPATKASLHFYHDSLFSPVSRWERGHDAYIIPVRPKVVTVLTFYRKTTLVRARVHTIFTDGGCGCGCGGTDRRGASVSIGPNHSTHLCPPSPLRPLSLLALCPFQQSAVHTTKDYSSLLPYPILSCPVLSTDGGRYVHARSRTHTRGRHSRDQRARTIVTHRNICRNTQHTATFRIMRAHSLSAPPGGARISLCPLIKRSVHMHTRCIHVHTEEAIRRSPVCVRVD